MIELTQLNVVEVLLIVLTPDLIAELQDMRYLAWSHDRRSLGTAGSYLKAYEMRNGRKIYYKLSCFDSVNGITGHECVNELIVDRLLSILGVEHVHYQLIHSTVMVEGREYETYICASEDYKEQSDSKMELDEYYDRMRKDQESPLDFCVRMGWSNYIYAMLVVDYLILNRDRHGANIEILKNTVTGAVRPAPLFDHGLSLIYSCKDEEAARGFDPLADMPVQSFVGTRSAYDNLHLIPGEHRPVLRRLEPGDASMLFAGLEDVIGAQLREKIWDMIWSRWCVYEDL